MKDLAIDMPDQMVAELAELQKYPPEISVGGVVVVGGDCYVRILGVFIDAVDRISAIEAQKEEKLFDKFELVRPLAWWVVVVPIDKLNPSVMVGSPQSIRVDTFQNEE